MRFFFITTDHLESKIWFRDKSDYVVGMNYVAVISFAKKIKVITFILMSNHVHFLLQCTKEEAREFISAFKALYGKYYCQKYGTKRFMCRNKIDIREITFENEALERVVAYIQMNSVAARISLEAGGYKWGTGACFFNDNRPLGKRLGDFSRRSQIRLLKSNVKLPQDWRISEDGYVLPESYVCIEFVQRLFKTPSRMMYFLHNSSKAKLVGGKVAPSFKDEIVLEVAKDLCRTLYFKKTFTYLTEEELTDLVKQLSRRLSADAHQICRVLGLSYVEVTRLLDRV